VFRSNQLLKCVNIISLALLLFACAHNDTTQVDDYQNIKMTMGKLNYGQRATDTEIAGWHIEISHGHNLPPGSGNAADGETLYDDKCASCHGSFGEGVGRNPVLAGGEGTLTNALRPEKTVGSYWPYASTLLDYTHRAMPFTQAQSLTWSETWALSAYVLYLNDIIVDEDFEFNASSYHQITMPNEQGFIFKDKEPDTHNTRCMADCKDASLISVKTALLGYDSGAEDKFDESQKAEPFVLGQNVYRDNCQACHETGIAGAPKINNKETWENRLKLGINQVYNKAINGFQGTNGFMPAKGGNLQLSNDQIKKAVDFMLKDFLD
jgi:cytochrome c